MDIASGRTGRRQRRAAASLAAMSMAVLAMAPTAASELPPADPKVSGGSSVSVDVTDVAGLDWVNVSSGMPEDDVPLGTSRTCVDAQRSLHHGGHLREIHREQGCVDGVVDYVFDPVSWQATVTANVPTTVQVKVYESTADGWHLLEQRETPATATVDLAWEGTGEQSVRPWAYDPVPSICYSSPPTVCNISIGGGTTATSEAVVDGSVHLGGLDVDLELRETPGAMRWWSSAEVWNSRLP